MAAPDPALSPLVVRLFGPFDVRVNGCALSRLRSRSGLSLLALLVLRHGSEVERDWLAGLLWPERSASQGLATLRRDLTDLRRALGAEAGRLRSPTQHSLCLDLTGASVDIAAFDALITRGDAPSLEQAAALYRGPLLEGWTAEWVFQERQPREQAYLRALELLAERAVAGGDTAAAERYLRRAMGVDPLWESAQRALMQVLAAGGNYAAAMLAYRDLRLRLHREINAEPDAETQALFAQLRAEAKRRAASSGSSHAGGPPETAGGAPTPLSLGAAGFGCQGTPIGCSRLRLPSAPAHNLPVPLTRFVGREREMAETKRLLASTHLLTLTGVGGCGKTRLALQVAAGVLEEFPDGVWLVELSALADPALMPQTVAAALGVREQAGRSVAETLLDALRPRFLLLLMDNCEHLLAAAAELAERLLRACPHLRLLATSREGLNIGGEQTFRVPPLSVPGVRAFRRSGVQEPPPEHLNAWTPERVMESEAVQLFVDRARARQPSFAVTTENAAAVAQICRRLDGMPLAIELAAVRVKALPVEQIAARLEDMFGLLTSGSRTALPRHKTLRALIDWSYDLLSEGEQMLLRRLSVFAGGWTLRAAEAVCSDFGFRAGARSAGNRSAATQGGGSGRLDFGLGRQGQSHSTDKPPALDPAAIQNPKSKIQNTDVLDLLTSLVDKSLVTYEDEGGEGRYRLLETVRQYARDRLLEAGETEAVRERHRDWCLALVGRSRPTWMPAWQAERPDDGRWTLVEQGFQGESETARLDRLEREHDNLRAALAWSGAQGQAEAGLRLGGALEHFWNVRGYWTEGRGHLAGLLALPGAAARTAARARALRGAGWLARIQADYGAARALLEESLAIFRELGNKQGIAYLLNSLGPVARDQGDYRTARALFEESLAIHRELEDKQGIAYSIGYLGLAARGQGDSGAARAFVEESLTIFRELGNKAGTAWSLNNLGWMAHDREESGAARALFEESLAIFRELGDKRGIAQNLEGLAALAVAQARPDRAARLLGAAEGLREAMGAPRPPADRAEHDRCVAAVRTALGEAGESEAGGPGPGFAAAWAEGRAMSLDESLCVALEQ